MSMNNIDMEQKLQLVRQVRSRYHEDQCDMSHREQILYGKSDIPADRLETASPYDDAYGDIRQPQGEGFTFFKLRLWVAILLAVGVIVMDKNNISVAGITTEQIFQAISADYEEMVEDWAEAISRNL